MIAAHSRHGHAPARFPSRKSSRACSSMIWARTWSAGAGCTFPGRRGRGSIAPCRDLEAGRLAVRGQPARRGSDGHLTPWAAAGKHGSRASSTHGFRYVEVTGFPGRPDLHSIEGRVVNDDLPVGRTFSLLQRSPQPHLHATSSGARAAITARLPTDCPQRDERQGWLGDRSEECKGEAYLCDIAPLYAKWRQDMADAQRTNSVIPDVAPGLLADLFRQRHLAQQRHHRAQRAANGSMATARRLAAITTAPN